MPNVDLVDELAQLPQQNPDSFPLSVVAAAWRRAASGEVARWSYCECRWPKHGAHDGRCGKRLSLRNRGRNRGPGCWEANHIIRREDGGPRTLGNCEILCWSCHKWTMKKSNVAVR